jgi:hypothetical protein
VLALLDLHQSQEVRFHLREHARFVLEHLAVALEPAQLRAQLLHARVRHRRQVALARLHADHVSARHLDAHAVGIGAPWQTLDHERAAARGQLGAAAHQRRAAEHGHLLDARRELAKAVLIDAGQSRERSESEVQGKDRHGGPEGVE